MAITVQLIVLDDGGAIESCDEYVSDKHGWDAVFPIVQMSCCGTVIARCMLKAERGMVVGCRVCGRDTAFDADGHGAFTVARP